MLASAGLLLYGGFREVQADREIFPLRRAITLQRLPGSETKLEDKPELILAALPDAERAFAISPHNADYAEYLGQAHLHLSRGTEETELRVAATWLQRSLALSPVNPWSRRTLLEIREQLVNPQPLPEIRRPRGRSGRVGG